MSARIRAERSREGTRRSAKYSPYTIAYLSVEVALVLIRCFLYLAQGFFMIQSAFTKF